MGLLSTDLAVDLGTTSTLIFERGEGIVCCEPTVVAVHTNKRDGKRKVVAVGAEAKAMLGRTPQSITALRPVRGGVINDFDMTTTFLKKLFGELLPRSPFARPRIVLTIPSGVSEIEKRAVREAAESAGARSVFLVESPMAAALGAELPVSEAAGTLVLDIGGGRTGVSLISMQGVVFHKHLVHGGDRIDLALTNFIRRRHNLLIGERTAERIKISLASIRPAAHRFDMEIHGRDAVYGVPKTAMINDREINECINESVAQVLELVRSALEKVPPELSADIAARGIAMVGGGSLLRGLDLAIAQEAGLPARVVDDPLGAVVQGAGVMLDRLDMLQAIAV